MSGEAGAVNLPVAIGLSVLAATCFAFAAVYQHQGVDGQTTAGDRSLSLGTFGRLFRQPRWLFGFGLSGLGALLHLSALSGASVAVVQPLAILAVPFAVLIGMRSTGKRPGTGVVLGILAAMIGVAIFVTLAANNTSSQLPSPSHIVGVGGAVALLIAVLVFLARRGPGWLHSLCWAAAGAAAYALAAAYMKAIFVQYAAGVALTSPTIWAPAIVLVATYPAAAYMFQHAFLSGAPEVVVGAMTVIDPMLAVLLGGFLLGEGSSLTPLVASGMVMCGLVAVAGVVVLSRHHPDADRHNKADRTPGVLEQSTDRRTDERGIPGEDPAGERHLST
ncbi:MAG: hypothetical protein L0G99_18380 [Propionibacteriales bacterium]|nr:hypothetical protein [Propionibacteriales bacterium]